MRTRWVGCLSLLLDLQTIVCLKLVSPSLDFAFTYKLLISISVNVI